MDRYDRENGYPCEYDDYPVPKPAIDLSPEERAAEIAKVEQELRELHEKLKNNRQ